jgi:hypothetical protein
VLQAVTAKYHVPFESKEDNVRTGFFEPDQFQAVLRRLSLPLSALMTFFYIIGWRKSDVLSLQWRQIDCRIGTAYQSPSSRQYVYVTEGTDGTAFSKENGGVSCSIVLSYDCFDGQSSHQHGRGLARVAGRESSGMASARSRSRLGRRGGHRRKQRAWIQ